jgi:hypothetical protein
MMRVRGEETLTNPSNVAQHEIRRMLVASDDDDDDDDDVRWLCFSIHRLCIDSTPSLA